MKKNNLILYGSLLALGLIAPFIFPAFKVQLSILCVLIKVRGIGKDILIEEAMKKCTEKHEKGCYVHYSSKVAFGQ